EVCALLIHVTRLVPLSQEHLVIKLCQLTHHLLNQLQVIVDEQTLDVCVCYVVRALGVCSPWTHSEVLQALSTLIYGNGPRCNRHLSELLGDGGVLRLYSDPSQPDMELRRAALTCMANICLGVPGQAALEDPYRSLCFRVFLQTLQSPKPPDADELLYCTVIQGAVKGLQSSLCGGKWRFGGQEELGALLARFMFHGCPGVCVEWPSVLYPAPLPQYETCSTPKPPEPPRNPPTQTSGRSSSDSEFSDPEGAAHSKLRLFHGRVRQGVLLCLLAVVKAVERRTLYGYWSSFIPDAPIGGPPPLTLLTVVLKDPSPKVRACALQVVSALLDGSRQFLGVAEDLAPPRTSYTPFSFSLATAVRELHRSLSLALLAEASAHTLTQIIKIIKVTHTLTQIIKVTHTLTQIIKVTHTLTQIIKVTHTLHSDHQGDSHTHSDHQGDSHTTQIIKATHTTQIIKATHTLTQIIKATHTLTQIIKATHTLTQIIKATHTLTQIIKATHTLTQIIKATHTLTQIIKATHTLTQIIKVTHTLTQIIKVIHTLTQIIKVTHTLTQIIKVTHTLTQIIKVTHTLTQIIKVTHTLTQIIKVTHTLTQIIKVTHTLTQIIKIIKVTHTLTQIIKATHTLTQIIKAIHTLTQIIKATHTLTQIIKATHTLTQIIKATHTLTQIIKVTHTLTQIIKIIKVTHTLTQIIKVTHTLTQIIKVTHTLTQIIKCLAHLVCNAPYNRLRPGLLSPLWRQIRPYLRHRDVNVRVSVLTLYGALVSTQAPLSEIQLLLTQPHTSQETALSWRQREGFSTPSPHTPPSHKYHNSHTKQTHSPRGSHTPGEEEPGVPWLLQLCVSLVTQPRDDQSDSEGPGGGATALEPSPVRLEALQVLAHLVRGYFPLCQTCLCELGQLSARCLRETDPSIQLHGAKLLEELGTGIIQQYRADSSQAESCRVQISQVHRCFCLAVCHTCPSATPVCLPHLSVCHTCLSATPVCLPHLSVCHTCLSATPVCLPHLSVCHTCLSATP
ncbi:unnamed protein product, partial [Coregonus sp. 'balchen']